MTILIENAETQEYFTNPGKWTKNAADGKNFLATVAAFEVAKLETIREFNIVCYIPQSRQFINMDHGRGIAAAN